MNCQQLLKETPKQVIQQIQSLIVSVSNESQSELTSSIIKQLPELLSIIFGKENQKSLIQRIFENRQNLVDLLSPNGSNNNIFQFLSQHSKSIKYQYPLTNLPEHTQFLINTQSITHVIYKNYIELFDYRQQFIKDNHIILSTFELFLVNFFYAFKHNFEPINHRALKSKTEIETDELQNALQNNVYLILIRQYLNYFLLQSQKKNSLELKKILFLIQDFYVNEFIYTPEILNAYIKQDYTYKMHQIFRATLKIPKPHIFQIIYVYQYFEQHYMNNPLQVKENYKFLLQMFKIWNRDLSNQYSNLSDIGRIWIKCLQPWTSNNLIKSLNKADVSKSQLDVQNEYAQFFYQNQQKQNFQDKVAQADICKSIKKNILMYTHIFKEFLIAFSDINELHVKDIIFLKELLDFYIKGIDQKNKTIINGIISVDWLKSISQGKTIRKENDFDLNNYLKYMEGNISNLNLLDDESAKNRACKIIANLKIFQDSFYFQKNFDKELNSKVYSMIQSIDLSLKHLFEIKEIQIQTQKNHMPYKNLIYLEKKRTSIDYTSWNVPLSTQESSFLFYILKSISEFISSKILQKKETINIRFLAKKLYLQLFALILFVYIYRFIL